ncbi:aldo/keto reductase [Acidobacteria bacterium AH-259-A15]|nr:aldo/keto reductase [Acidobacteria bacterium AH-259-A15]
MAVAVAGTVIGKSNPLPTRMLGRTGLRTPILALGCGNRLHMGYPSEERGIEAIELALNLGINYLDTAQSYGDGKSERWVGRATRGRSRKVILATKTQARRADEVYRRCEQSLKRLQTDYLDVLHLHSLKWEDDLAQIEAKGGALEALYKLRDEKVVRFIGVTSHTDPETLAKALERHDFDCTQMVLNAGQQGRSPDGKGSWKRNPDDPFSEPIPPKPDEKSFQKVALPVANRKNLGVIAMKVTGQDSLIGTGPGKAAATELLRYALSLPVTLATNGMPKLQYIRENIEMARNFRPMSRSEMEDFSRRIVETNKARL